MSKINYDALQIDGLKEVFIQINETCTKLEIDFFIIGAIARNIWFVENDEEARGTKDIDFGVYIPDVNKYSQLKDTLKEEYKYIESSGNDFCLITQDGKQIDLLPFGEIEDIEGDKIPLTAITFDGFKETFEFGLIDVNIGDEKYKSCSIPAVMILKLIAFDDRPEIRGKDAVDIDSICQYYPSIEEEHIWSNYFNLYEEGREHEQVGIMGLGREMKKLTKSNKELEDRLLSIMDKAINEESRLLPLMIQNSEKETIEMKRKVFEWLKLGFTESSEP